jgi:hypothetical protein
MRLIIIWKGQQLTVVCCTKYDDRLGIKEWDWLLFKDPPSFQPIKLEKGGRDIGEDSPRILRGEKGELSSLHAVKILKSLKKNWIHWA